MEFLGCCQQGWVDGSFESIIRNVYSIIQPIFWIIRKFHGWTASGKILKIEREEKIYIYIPSIFAPRLVTLRPGNTSSFEKWIADTFEQDPSLISSSNLNKTLIILSKSERYPEGDDWIVSFSTSFSQDAMLAENNFFPRRKCFEFLWIPREVIYLLLSSVYYTPLFEFCSRHFERGITYFIVY